MTKEQFERAVQINERLEDLEEVKKEIQEIELLPTIQLWYIEKDRCDNRELLSEWSMSRIRKILDKHDQMIRMEIDEEINQLKAEIETL